MYSAIEHDETIAWSDLICRERPIEIPMQCNEINSTEKRQKREQQLIPKSKQKNKKKKNVKLRKKWRKKNKQNIKTKDKYILCLNMNKQNKNANYISQIIKDKYIIQ